MKIHFEGTMAEFQALFYGMSDEEGEFQPSGRDKPAAFDVIPGDKALADGETEAERPVIRMPPPRSAPRPPVRSEGLTATLTEEERTAGWEKFKEVCREWMTNFGETEEVEVERTRPLRNEQGELVDEEGNRLTTGYAVQVPYTTTETRPKQPQPDRMELLRELGHGRYPKAILVMAYEIGSLQQLVGKALLEECVVVGGEKADHPVPQLGLETVEAYQDYVDLIAMNMVQISHMVFPDLAGTYDYTEKWKRSE